MVRILACHTGDSWFGSWLMHRSGDVVEARLKEQWFLNCQQMAERAVQAVKQGELTFSAPHHEALWYEWLSKGRDWCLSRQLWWGHRIPAYRFQTEEGEVWVSARNEAEAVSKFSHLHPGTPYLTVTQDEDVLDTWFSSALLPFTVFGWPENTESLREFYPLSLMETGQDILFFWVARMVMLGLELTDALPFRHVLLHGLVRDTQGRKMSKSLGNVVDPLDVIRGASLQDLHSGLDSSRLRGQEMKLARDGQRNSFPLGIPECGADALRFTLCSYDFKADGIPMDILHTRTHRLFCNKVWQSFRFTQQHLQHEDFTPLDTYTKSGHEAAVDRWILSRVSDMVGECDRGFQSHNLHQAAKALHRFWLTEFCDVYLECSKPVFQSQDVERQSAVRQILYLLMHTFLRALGPFMPFLTEELYQRLPVKGDHWPESVCVAPYPLPCEYPWQNATVDDEMSQVLQLCQHILSIRHAYTTTKPLLPVHIVVKTEDQRQSVSQYVSVMSKLCRAEPVTLLTADQHADHTGCATSVVNSHCRVHVQLKGHVDLARELDRLLQKRSKVLEQQEHVTSRLSDLVQKGKGHIPAAQKLQVKGVIASCARNPHNLTFVGTDLRSKYMTVCCFNAQSISRKRNKRVEIENVIRDESIDIMFITETWLKPQGDEAACVDVTPGGYSMRSFPRQARRGGGIAFITRNSLFEHATVTEFPFDHNSFELVQLTLDGHHRVNFFCLYRPPPSKVNKLTDGMFFEEFSELLEHANVMGGKTLFLGDFNISWDRPAHPTTVKAVDLLDMFSLSQAVNFPTHRDGHTIDWCVFREEELILRSVSPPRPSLTSDHMPVMCYLDIAKPASTPVFQTVRNLRAIDKSQFRADVAAVFHNQPPATVEQLEAHLRAVLEVHAPAIRRLQTQRRSSPWYSAIAEELRSLKQKRRPHVQWALLCVRGTERDADR
ncbi:hypothetical protein ACOMHN_002235 [Nucella lapillus]